jgi:DNA (cytosine-5)-methyltransferase 1
VHSSLSNTNREPSAACVQDELFYDDPTETYEISPSGEQVLRRILTRDGGLATSAVSRNATASLTSNPHDLFDLSWLRSTTPPIHSNRRGQVKLIDLFSGCGALSLGIEEACRALELGVKHIFAADINPLALDTYSRNFPGARYCGDPIESLVGPIDSPLSEAEKILATEFGEIDILAGGPPCQGHSDLNNHTRRQDPKNALFESMIRFAQILHPKHLIIENVPGVRNDKRGVTEIGRRALEAMGYKVFETVLVATHLGAAQRRRRYIMVATRQPGFSFQNLTTVERERSLRWACEDLATSTNSGILDSHASSSKDNRTRIQYLFDNDLYDLPNELRPACHRLKKHSYQAVYGRLKWDEPAPTITSGFNSPGQGRFIHPSAPRTLTPHEAARLQYLPDFFDWGKANREGLTQMIGNAVPPKLAYAVALELLR